MRQSAVTGEGLPLFKPYLCSNLKPYLCLKYVSSSLESFRPSFILFFRPSYPRELQISESWKFLFTI